MSNNATTVADVPVPQAIIMIIAPPLIGTALSWGLYGILVVQLYIYYLSFPKDHLWIKVTVYGLFLIDTLQNAVCVETAWFYLVSGWGRPAALQQFSFGFRIIPAICGVVSLWVQTFYCWRIYTLGNNRFWRVAVVFIIMVSLTQTIASIYVTSKLFTFTIESQWHELEAPIGIWNVGSVIADVVIAFCMLSLLWDAGRRTSAAARQETQLLLHRLMQLSIETGALTAAVVLVDTGVIYGLPNSTMFLIFSMMQSKVYTNSLMATLNSRSRLLSRRYDSERGISIGSNMSAPHYRSGQDTKHHQRGVLIEHTSVAMVDTDRVRFNPEDGNQKFSTGAHQGSMYFDREHNI